MQKKFSRYFKKNPSLNLMAKHGDVTERPARQTFNSNQQTQES
jgi:hypothetical protein